MKTPGFLKDTLFYLRTLTTISVLSIGLQTYNLVASTSEESISGSIESLEVEVGELKVRAIGRNTTALLTNLIQSANRWGMLPTEEKSYQSTSLKGPATLKRPNNSSYIMF
tara:strand:- start:124 stop:456 length:333 start_codon:yes stop_codon:yes gene_type:complete